MSDELSYGPDQAFIHHHQFGRLAAVAAEDLLALLGEAGLGTGTVVDLGSGSGILARLVTDAGYDVVGVDIAPAMVELAREHAPLASFRQGSLLDAEIPPAMAVTAIGEALNYATDPRAGLGQLEPLAKRIHDALVPGGLFLFDISTPGRADGGLTHQFHDREQWSVYVRIEETTGDATLTRDIVTFRKNEDGCYLRSDEHHVLQRAGFDADVRGDYASARDLPPIHGWTVILGRKPAG